MGLTAAVTTRLVGWVAPFGIVVGWVAPSGIGWVAPFGIVDAVAVVADPVDLSDSALLIEGLNFRPIEVPVWVKPLNGTSPLFLLEKPRHGEPTHRVYVVGQGSRLLDKTIQLRDYFRVSPEAAIDFEAEKIRIWKQCDGEPSQYHAAMGEEFQRRLDQLG